MCLLSAVCCLLKFLLFVHLHLIFLFALLLFGDPSLTSGSCEVIRCQSPSRNLYKCRIQKPSHCNLITLFSYTYIYIYIIKLQFEFLELEFSLQINLGERLRSLAGSKSVLPWHRTGECVVWMCRFLT